jgi:hypothetical protein
MFLSFIGCRIILDLKNTDRTTPWERRCKNMKWKNESPKYFGEQPRS